MGLKSDKWIKDMAMKYRMIEPFEEKQVRDGTVSYGLSSYGYDIRIADEFKVISNLMVGVVDPKNFPTENLITVKDTGKVTIPPNSFVLARSVEYIRMPENVLGIVVGKSTYARCGIIVNITPLEPGWKGYITIEISNTNPIPAVVYANEGISQILFFEGDEQCSITYGDRKGKYQDQTGIWLPRI